MSEDQFTKLFNYMRDFRKEVGAKLGSHDGRFSEVEGAIVELSAQVRDYHNEMLVQSYQFNKLRDAIRQIAKETGVKLSVEI